MNYDGAVANEQLLGYGCCSDELQVHFDVLIARRWLVGITKNRTSCLQIV